MAGADKNISPQLLRYDYPLDHKTAIVDMVTASSRLDPSGLLFEILIARISSKITSETLGPILANSITLAKDPVFEREFSKVIEMTALCRLPNILNILATLIGQILIIPREQTQAICPDEMMETLRVLSRQLAAVGQQPA